MTKPHALSRGVVLLTAIVTLLFLLLASSVQAGSRVRATHTLVVRPGETLWSVAADLSPPGGDVRPTIFLIRRLNGMEGSVLVPGQELTVPAG